MPKVVSIATLALASLFTLIGLQAGQMSNANEWPLEHPDQPVNVELEAILRHAATESPLMIERQIQLAQKDASRFRGGMRYLPEVNMSYGLGGSHEIRDSLDSDERNRPFGRLQLRANHPLYHWGAYGAQQTRAFSEENEAAEQARLTYAELVTQLRQAYFQLVVSKQQLRKLKKETRRQQDRVETVELRLKQGTATRVALEEAKAKLRSLRIDAARTDSDYHNQLTLFRNQSGLKDFTPDDIPDQLEIPEIHYETLRERLAIFRRQAFAGSLPARISREQKDILESELTMVRAEQKPIFNLGVSVMQRPIAVDESTELQTIFFAGVTGRWNLFDRQKTRYNIRSLKQEKRLVNAQLDARRANLFTRAENALRSLQLALDAVDVRRDQLSLAREDLELARERENKGEISEEALKDRQLKTFQARISLLEAKVSVLHDYYEFLGSIFADPALSHLHLDHAE